MLSLRRHALNGLLHGVRPRPESLVQARHDTSVRGPGIEAHSREDQKKNRDQDPQADGPAPTWPPPRPPCSVIRTEPNRLCVWTWACDIGATVGPRSLVCKV
jgi:hypothetical protein